MASTNYVVAGSDRRDRRVLNVDIPFGRVIHN